MLDKRVWAALLDVEGAVVEDVEFDPVGQVVTAFVRPARRARLNRPGMSGVVRPGLGGVELLESHATVMDLVFSNSIGVSIPSWLCRRRRLCQISR